MKTLIVGRTSRGKDFLCDVLKESYGWKFVKSATTRKPRYENEDTHRFISREEAENTPESEIIAKTEINGEIYFATKEDLDQADAYVIDPNGIEYLFQMCPEEWFQIVYISADADRAREKAKERVKDSSDPEKEMAIYDSRAEAEDDQFTQFEAIIENGSMNQPCCKGITMLKNDFKPETVVNFAIGLEMNRRFYENIKPIIEYAKSTGYIAGNDGIVDVYDKKTNEPAKIREEHLIQLMLKEPKKDMFGYLMEAFLFRPTNDGHKTAPKSPQESTNE